MYLYKDSTLTWQRVLLYNFYFLLSLPLSFVLLCSVFKVFLFPSQPPFSSVFFNCCCRDTPIFGLHLAPPPPSDLPHSYSAPCILIFFFCRLICSAWATCLSMILAHYYNVYNAWLPENFIRVHLCWNNIPWLWIYFSLKFNILVVHKIFCYVFSC